MARYRQILSTPGIPILLVASTLGRLPYGINGLALLLLLRETTGSFAVAGLATGGLALGAGAGAPFVSRLVDRRGLGPLMPLACAHAGALVALVLLAEADGPHAVLVALSVFAGVTFPPSGSVLRARWPQLMGRDPELVSSAYALDSVLIEISFISGPLITAGIVAVAGPDLALFVSAGLLIVGTAAFLAALPHEDSERPAGERGILGALAIPAVRVIAFTSLPVGFCLGSIEVAIPAFTHAEGQDELGGVLLALWSLASAVGGLVFGARADRGETRTMFLRIAVIFPLTCVPLALVTSPLGAAAAVIIAGLPIAPLIATRNELLAVLTPGTTATEAFTWLMTALVAGLAAGSAVAGALVEAQGWEAAVLAGIAVALAGAFASVGARRALAPAPAAAAEPAVP
jgi:MFS family permease